MEQAQTKDELESIHSEKSIIDEKFRKNTYKRVLPLRIYNYWLNKLFSEKMNIVALDKNGAPISKAEKRIANIFKRSNFRDVVSKYLAKKSMGEGYGAITVKLAADTLTGKPIPIFAVAEGVVKYNTYMETDTSVTVIEDIARGIVPLIRIKEYGKNIDRISYDVAEGFSIDSYEGDDKGDIQKLLKKSQEFVHNYGFVRAVIFRNRVDDKHYDYGQNDLNGFWDLVDNIDLTNNRLSNEIDQNTTHISRTLSSGTILGVDDESYSEDFENQMGMIKETYRSIDTEEGVDSVVIQGDITLSNLQENLIAKITELDQLTGIQVGYDATGKTNDTTHKTSMIGDPAHREASLRKSVEEEFWTKIAEICMKIDSIKSHWKGVEELSIRPRVNDFRTKSIMLEQIDKIAKYYPLKDMYVEMLDVSPQIAEDMVDNKEKEIKSKMVSALPAINGNLPQNIKVPFDWAEEVEEPAPEMGEQETDEGDNNETDN